MIGYGHGREIHWNLLDAKTQAPGKKVFVVKIIASITIFWAVSQYIYLIFEVLPGPRLLYMCEMGY